MTTRYVPPTWPRYPPPPLTPQRLRELRELAGVSQFTLARALGVHEDTMLAWETGKHKIPIPVALAYAVVHLLECMQ